MGQFSNNNCHQRKLVSVCASVVAPLDLEQFLVVCITASLSISNKAHFEHKIYFCHSLDFGELEVEGLYTSVVVIN